MKLFKAQKGQVMLLTTLVLSGTILAAVTIAGLLLVYQIRQAGNVAQSTRAIYAADAGFERDAFRLFQAVEYADPLYVCGVDLSSFSTTPTPEFSIRTVVVPDSDDGIEDVYMKSSAISGNTTRAIDANFEDLGSRVVCTVP